MNRHQHNDQQPVCCDSIPPTPLAKRYSVAHWCTAVPIVALACCIGCLENSQTASALARHSVGNGAGECRNDAACNSAFLQQQMSVKLSHTWVLGYCSSGATAAPFKHICLEANGRWVDSCGSGGEWSVCSSGVNSTCKNFSIVFVNEHSKVRATILRHSEQAISLRFEDWNPGLIVDLLKIESESKEECNVNASN